MQIATMKHNESIAEFWARTTIRKRAAEEIVDPDTGEVLAEAGQIISRPLYHRITAALDSSHYIPRMFDVTVIRKTAT